MTDALARAGELALEAAENLFKLDVYDPSVTDKSARAVASRTVIDHILSAAGWGFATPYRGNGPPQWCGLFAATCWRSAGLDPKWLATYWASTYRLRLWATYEKFDAKHPNPMPTDGDLRFYASFAQKDAGYLVRPGDVVIVGDGDPQVGDHITIAVRFDDTTGVVETISGNGGGLGPDGKNREGIVKRSFPVGPGSGYRCMWLVRPAFGDLQAEQA